MAFVRDHGQCCLCLPLKLGVGLVCMYYFSYGMFCLVAIFKSTGSGEVTQSTSINLQFGGYNPSFFRLSTIVGIIGIFAGFIGILGVYDDKPGWIRFFHHYLQIELVFAFLVFFADIWTLSGCEKYASLPEDQRQWNPALMQLSNQNMCSTGRIGYILGFALQTILALYMLYNVWKYVSQLELNPPYPIDFGYENYDSESRWKFYNVKKPEQIPMFANAMPTYQATEEEVDAEVARKEFNPDGVKGAATYAPDGFLGPAYIRADRPPPFQTNPRTLAGQDTA